MENTKEKIDAENLSEEKKKEVESKIQEAVKTWEEVEKFKTDSLGKLQKLYETTKPEIIAEVNNEFMKAIAETGMSFKEIGKEYFNRMNESFKDIFKQIPTDRVLDARTRNLYTAITLMLFGDIEDFMKDDETRKQALMHVNFINAAFRAKNIRYNGCKAQWDAEDKALKDMELSLKSA